MRTSRSVLTIGLSIAILSFPAAPPAHAGMFQNRVVSSDPADNTPRILDGKVNAIVQIGEKIYAGGVFTQVRSATFGPILDRTNLLAFTAETGAIDLDFAPVLDGEVYTLAAAPDGSLLVGGAFQVVNGVFSKALVKLDRSTGLADSSFNARPDGRVRTMSVNGNRLFIGGSFTAVSGISRSRLAAVDATTGAVDPGFDLPITASRKAGTASMVIKMDIDPAGTTLVVLGNFKSIAGFNRWQVVLIDVSSTPAAVLDWHTARYGEAAGSTCSKSFDTYMRDIDFSPDGSYFVIVTTGAHSSGSLCDTAARWETSRRGSNQQPTWTDYSGGDTFYSVAVTGSAIYVGGHMRWLNNPFAADFSGPGAVPREGIGALDPVNGVPLSWNPGRSRGVGAFELYPTADGLWVGSDTNRIGGEDHPKIALMPLSGGTVSTAGRTPALPNDLVHATFGSNPVVLRQSFDGVTAGEPAPVAETIASSVRGLMAIDSTVYAGWSDNKFYRMTYDQNGLGTPVVVNLYALNNFSPKNISGMFYNEGQVFYTLTGNSSMFRRGFSPESRIMASEVFTVPGSVNWSSTRGITYAGGKIFFANTNGDLLQVEFANSQPSGEVQTVLAATPQRRWDSMGMFFYPRPDSQAPTAPGIAGGLSVTANTIDLEWSAATDDVSTQLTYEVFRDGGPTPVGTVLSGGPQVTFQDTGLSAGSAHTYTVRAVDDAGNTGPLSQASDPIPVPDLQPPSAPGALVTDNSTPFSIGLSWSAATDDVSTLIEYEVFRDGGSTPHVRIASAGPEVEFRDGDLTAGSTHRYRVRGIDEAGNIGPLGEFSPVTFVDDGNTVFADDFASGGLSSWTFSAGLSIDSSASAAPPSVAGSPVLAGAYAYRDFAPQPVACASADVNVGQVTDSAVDLLRFKSAGAGMVRSFLTPSRELSLRSDVDATYLLSQVVLPEGWHNLKMCGSPGEAAAWDLYLDGELVVDRWIANAGAGEISRIQIGDPAAKTWSFGFDDVKVTREPRPTSGDD